MSAEAATFLIYVFGSLALAMGTGIVCLSLLKMERREDKGRIYSKGGQWWSR